MRIGFAEQFIGPFRRCIERDWRIGTVGHPKRRFGAHTVNRRRRSINQMRELSVTRELENIDVSRDIRMDIGGGGFKRIRSDEHTVELQTLMRIMYDVIYLKTKTMKA